MENLTEELKKTNEILDKFEEATGLKLKVNDKTIEIAQELMSIDWFDYKHKSAYELMVDSCILTDYAGIMQRVVNREKANVLWCKERIKRHVGTEIPKQKAYSYDERETLALSKHSLGQSLHYKKIESELHLARLENLYFTIKNLSDRIDRLADVKLKEEELQLRKKQVES